MGILRKQFLHESQCCASERNNASKKNVRLDIVTVFSSYEEPSRYMEWILID